MNLKDLNKDEFGILYLALSHFIDYCEERIEVTKRLGEKDLVENWEIRIKECINLNKKIFNDIPRIDII